MVKRNLKSINANANKIKSIQIVSFVLRPGRHCWCIHGGPRDDLHVTFLGAFAKFRKATISFAMSVCPHGTAWLPSTFSSTTLCEFRLAQLFLSISSSPTSFVSNWSPPSSSNHSSYRLPIFLLVFPSVLLHTVSICVWSWSLFH